ncbi:Rossman fold protein, TIGR00730 family [Pseudomonas avellanae]|uniref:Cytokinin riboside 5'-monophosphate phosphoribohydrolase n=2 Tax=Pseudomonas syringae group TaxID=136849 RepID=A0A261WIC0_9PSED|nr:TIGR00730 family Rossman fold protein [Pseudomonas syringae]ATV18076.1 TIGR00730 family Rossman fold protein [Pseudomonas syringae pv. actinidiae]OZI85896.1 Rossman fold protein, TIGR00730 family [Pseudomonas avellanae]PIN59559.1 TIGR00730 family Rossman fold protein [Pseudomonas syringae pv. actinidiae]GAO91143.1 hypothetical protein PSA5_00520 [Pseudomonas syringae pv. actinidiae]
MNVCVFCSSGEGRSPVYASVALETGAQLALRGDTVVHGGAIGGLMGKLTEGARLNGGRVIGVTSPEVRHIEWVSSSLQDIIETQTLSERKRKMMELADEFVILPGGFGTLDETCEIITRKQLGLTSQPISFINVNGYWERFFDFIEAAETEDMIVTKGRDTFRVYASLEDYLHAAPH